MKCYAVYFCLLVVGMFAFTTGALTTFGKRESDCTIDDHHFNKGETYSKPGECSEYKCNGPQQMSALTCPPSAAKAGCRKVPQANSKPYPQCCSYYECFKN